MENTIKILSAIGGGIAGFCFGGWSVLLNALLFFVVADYITGFIAGSQGDGLDSKRGFKGIAKKVCIFSLVAVAHYIDEIVGTNIIMEATIFFYLANELLSIVENIGRLGVGIPKPIREAIAILRVKSGDQSTEEKGEQK